MNGQTDGRMDEWMGLIFWLDLPLLGFSTKQLLMIRLIGWLLVWLVGRIATNGKASIHGFLICVIILDDWHPISLSFSHKGRLQTFFTHVHLSGRPSVLATPCQDFAKVVGVVRSFSHQETYLRETGDTGSTVEACLGKLIQSLMDNCQVCLPSLLNRSTAQLWIMLNNKMVYPPFAHQPLYPW